MRAGCSKGHCPEPESEKQERGFIFTLPDRCCGWAYFCRPCTQRQEAVSSSPQVRLWAAPCKSHMFTGTYSTCYEIYHPGFGTWTLLDGSVESFIAATKTRLGMENLLRIVHLFPVSSRKRWTALMQTNKHTNKSSYVQYNPLNATIQREDSAQENQYNLPVLKPTTCTCFLGKATFAASILTLVCTPSRYSQGASRFTYILNDTTCWPSLREIYKYIPAAPGKNKQQTNKKPTTTTQSQERKKKKSVIPHTTGRTLKAAQGIQQCSNCGASHFHAQPSPWTLMFLICSCICMDNLIIRSSDCTGCTLNFHVFVFLPTRMSS